MTTTRQRSWPLFLRIFVLILLTVLLVQLLNFAAVLLMPPPTPAIYSTNRIALVARAGSDTTGLLVTSLTHQAPQARGDERDRRLARLIAADLALPADAVVVEGRRNGPPMMVGAFRPPIPMGMPGPPPQRSFALDNGLFGSFAVSVKVAPGTWRVIRPAGSATGPWRTRLILWFLVAMAVAAPIAWALARRVAKPIGLFAAAAERLGRDPRAPPLPLSGPPEIAEAATAFNLMQERLNRYVEDRTMLIAAVAHDLRTPLMRLSLRLEKASDDIRIASEDDIQEMSQRIGAAMAFVRDMTRHVRRQRLDLRSLAESITDQFGDRGDRVTLAPGPDLPVEGDGPALKALLANLVDNAVKYAGSADVTLRRERDAVIIEVADNGPGLAPYDLDQAFEPFFRAEKSRSRDTGGIGLGLASVRAVARAHGGDAVIENRPGGGLLARVTLPG
jgi:two-component system OmpR family sensor kinase